MKKIKILYESSILANGLNKNYARSGIFFVAYNVLISLSKRRDVSLFLYCNDQQKVNEINKFIQSDRSLKKLNFIGQKCKYQKVYNFLHNLTLNIVVKFFGKEYPKSKFDIFFSPVFNPPEDINKNKEIKKFHIIYDIIPLLYPKLYPGIESEEAWLNVLMRSVDKEKYYFTISDSAKRDFLKYKKDLVDCKNVLTTHLATSDDFYQCKNKKQIAKVLEKYAISKNIKKYMFSLCALEPRKNLIHTVTCFVKMIKKYKINDLYFVLGGEVQEVFITLLEQEINGFDKYKDRIIKIGYVDDEDLSPLYSGSMCFVYPSLYEGFGLPSLEAMKCGTPVITSNTSSLPEVVGDAGIMVDPKSEEQLIDAIYKLYKDDKLRKELIKKGLKRAKLFTWEKTVEKMVKKFKEVLE